MTPDRPSCPFWLRTWLHPRRTDRGGPLEGVLRGYTSTASVSVRHLDSRPRVGIICPAGQRRVMEGVQRRYRFVARALIARELFEAEDL